MKARHTKRTINMELLSRIRDLYKNDPKTEDQSVWQSNYAKTASIAGWVLILTGFDIPRETGHDFVAQARAGLSRKQYRRLCYVSKWPKDLRSRYNTAKSQEERATVAVERLERFITNAGGNNL